MVTGRCRLAPRVFSGLQQGAALVAQVRAGGRQDSEAVMALGQVLWSAPVST